jgi:hypothetical protein
MPGGGLGHRGEPGVVGLTVLELVHPPVELLLDLRAGRGQAEQVEEHLVRRRPGQFLGQVHGAAVPPGVDQAADDRADRVLPLRDAVGQQLRLDHPADLVVPRVVDVGQEPGPALVLRGVVDVDALVGQERLRVRRRRADVLEPGQRPPVPLLAVEHRGLVAHPAVHRERVGLELLAERVVLHHP